MRTHTLFRLVSAFTLSVFLCQSTVVAQPQPPKNSYLALNTPFTGDGIDQSDEKPFADAVRERFAIEGDGLVGDGIGLDHGLTAGAEAGLRLSTTTRDLLARVGYARDPSKVHGLLNPEMGRRKYEQMPHIFSPVVLAANLEYIEKNLLAIEQARKSLPAQFKSTQTLVLTPRELEDQIAERLPQTTAPEMPFWNASFEWTQNDLSGLPSLPRSITYDTIECPTEGIHSVPFRALIACSG